MEGMFISGSFDSEKFLELIDHHVSDLLKAINKTAMDREERLRSATELHRRAVWSIPDSSFWTKSFEPRWINKFNEKFSHISGASLTSRASVCYACLFGRPEYMLPCGHIICVGCLQEFDQSSSEWKYPGVARHEECVLCAAKETKGWPYIKKYRPELAGIRVLSLDGGGVRAIIQLSILQRLEKLLDFDLPIAELFDLIVGTSAGKGMIQTFALIPELLTFK